MVYAIVEASGTQLKVEEGRFYDVNRVEGEAESTITLDQVLFIGGEGSATIGQPLVAGATVEAKILKHMRGPKVIVYKMRPKKKTRTKNGHRQELSRILVTKIATK
jgi:large subunit ribosomal protein L21